MARFVTLGAFLLAIGLVYGWTPASYPKRGFNREPTEFYHALSRALLAGKLSLFLQPDPRLVALADPYDPRQNAPYRVDNLSYFNGRYYLYMGIAPAVLFFIPVKLLTGYYISHELAVVIFCLAGLAAGIGAILRLASSCRHQVSPLTLAGIFLALAFGNGYYAVLPGSLAQEVALAGAHAFAMIGLLAAACAMTAPRAWAWTAVASFAVGAAIACRPEYVLAGFILPALLLASRGTPRQIQGPALGRMTLAAILPLGCVVAALLAYNYARFGSLLEFGQHYMLGGWDQRHLANASGRNSLANGWRYLLAPASYSRDFPFVSAGGPLAVGILRNVPWLWLLPVSFWALTRKEAAGPLRTLAMTALAMALANLLVLVCLPSGQMGAESSSANSRYLLDFLPELSFVVGAGLLAAGELAGSGGPGRRWLAVAAAMAAAASVLAGLSLDFERFPPETYRAVSRILDLPDYAVRSLGAPAYGPVSIELTFPAAATGRYEPLVETGVKDAANLLYVFFPRENEIQFGFVGSGIRGPLSDQISLRPGEVHHLEISLGALYPPTGYPTLARFSEAQVAFLKKNLQVVLDGHSVFDATVYCYPAPPSSVRLGENSLLPGYSVDKFSGHILAEKRAPLEAPTDAQLPRPAYGPIRLRLRFPQDRAGRCEPLVVSGVPQAADFIYVRYLDQGHLRLGLDHWGGAGAETPVLAVDLATPHTLEVSMGSLFPPGTRPSRVACELDGVRVLELDRETYASAPSDVAVGVNAIGGSTCNYAFTGKILQLTRGAPAAP